jgi:uncharacterized protein YjbI with pentapeptide repeats
MTSAADAPASRPPSDPDELIRRYGAGERGFSGANLQQTYPRDADLQDADLSGATFAGAYLLGAALDGADLRGADLRGANLTGTSLRRSDLRDSDLTAVVGRRWTDGQPVAISAVQSVRSIAEEG